MRKRSTVRVVLYFPEDHPVSQYPEKERNTIVKALVDSALTQKSILEEIYADIKDIKDTLSKGISQSPSSSQGIKLSDSDIALIDQMLGRH